MAAQPSDYSRSKRFKDPVSAAINNLTQRITIIEQSLIDVERFEVSGFTGSMPINIYDVNLDGLVDDMGLIEPAGTQILRFATANMTANRVLTIDVNDADRTITLQGDPTLNDWFDQAVKQASAVIFGSVDTGQGANELYDMNQNVLTSSSVSFVNVNATGIFKVDGTQVVTNRQAAVADVAVAGADQDSVARTAINLILARMRTHGLLDP